MKKRDILFVAGALLVVAALYYLSTTGKHPPYIPADDVHVAAKVKEDCQVCHGKDKEVPMKPGHPFKDQCLRCHKRAEAGK